MKRLRSAAALTLALLNGLISAPAFAQVTIDSPRGGWKHSAGERASFVQSVRYPASSVNTENADVTALITGHILKQQKSAPATLIVNGVAMPLSVDANGAFARPYAFGSGSNSIEVIAPDGNRARRQYVDAYAGRAPAKLRVVLSWDSDGTDLDLHVVTPMGEHSFWANRVIPGGGALDVDVTTGYGPEIFSHPAPDHGAYHIYVNYYGAGSGRDEIISVAQVAVITDENTPKEKQEVFRIPLRNPGELTLVKSFRY